MNDTQANLQSGLSFGGGFAGVLLFGRFILNWLAGRLDKRQEQIAAEDAALNVGWREYRHSLEKRLRSIERQNRALLVSFQHVSAGLIRRDPHAPELQTAERIMAAAFPSDFTMAAQMAEAAIDKMEDDA